MKTFLCVAILVIMLVVPVFAFADHNSPHTITQIQAQIVAIQAQLKALQSASPSQEAVKVQTPVTRQSTIPELPTTTVLPIFDDDTSDDDIVQLNNLRIQSISSPNLPAIIYATYDSGARCLRYESESSAKGLSIPCPVSLSYLYQIRVDQHTVLLLRNRGRAGISQFEAGDRINVYGFKDRDTGAVDALIVRNLDKPLVKRFIQLNNVEVTQAAYPPTPPATVVVIQKGVSPCFEFGEHGSGSGSAFPCPLGLEVSEESVPNQAKSMASSLYYPRPRQYFVDVNSQTKIIQRDRNPMLLKDIQVGDVLNIYGVERQDKKTIEAITIRDISVPKVVSTGILQIIVSDAEFSGVLYDATVEAYNDQAILVGKKQVGERGSVIFESLLLGKYTIVASAPGYQSGKQQIVVDKPGQINAFTVTLVKEGGTISNLAPRISGVKGPLTLAIGEVGTWAVIAYDPEQGPLSYTAIWGDEESRLNQPLVASSPTAEAQQTATFTHSYAKAGVYNPTFIVTDNGGLSAKTSISVNVGEVSVSQPIYEAGPSGTLVQNQSYSFKGSVRNALPYKPVYFYLQRPDGSMKYDEKNDILAKAENRSTDSTGYFSISAVQQIPNEGQTGIYTSWVTVGGVASNKIYHTVVSGSVVPAITVVSPNGGESWQRGSTQTIKWSSSNAPTVMVDLIRPGYECHLTNGDVPNTGFLTFIVSNCVNGLSISSAADYKIRVMYRNNAAVIVQDESDAPFSIVSTSGVDMTADIKAYPDSFNPVPSDGPLTVEYGKSVTVSWASKNAKACTASGNWPNFSGSKALEGKESTAPNNAGTYIATISCTDGKTTVSDSISISVSPPSQSITGITVLAPNGGETWQTENMYRVSWKYAAPFSKKGSISVEIWKGNQFVQSGGVAADDIYSVTSYDYKLPNDLSPGSDYKIKVLDSNNEKNVDSSDAPFSIIGGTVVVPTLNVAVDASSPTSATFPAGTVNVTFAKIKVTAGTEAVNNMNAIQVGSDSSNAAKTLSNFKVYDGSTLLSSSSFDLDYNGSYYYKWLKVNGFSVPANTSKVLTVVADVKSTAPSGTVRLGIAGWNFDALGTQIKPFGTPLYGNVMSVVSTQPSITVVSPNGGEVWQVGSTQTIMWSSAGNISLVDITTTNVPSTYIASSIPNTGSYTWTIPSNFPTGQYRFRIAEPTGGPEKGIDESNTSFTITAPIFYPGFFMKTDKSLYSLNDTVLLTLSRADNRTEPYAVDLYGMNSGGSDKVLISPNLQVGQNTITKIQLNQWPLFTKGGAGQYLFATCSAGCTYGSDQNTNSVVIELSTAQSSLTTKKNLAGVLEAMRLQLAAMTELVKKLSR